MRTHIQGAMIAGNDCGQRGGVAYMNLRHFVLAALLVAVATGCGGGGGGGSSENSAPSISNLTFSPVSALQGEGNGTIIVTGSLTFSDPGGDVNALHLTDSQGESITEVLSGFSGITSGTIQAQVTISTQTVGHYTFQVYVTDSQGLDSNRLSGSFDVNPINATVNWTQQTLPLPSGSTAMLKRVIWSGSMFVAVGDDVFTSPDGVTWTERETGLDGTLMDVTWTGREFVAVGGDVNGNDILTSPDGVSWTPQLVPSTINLLTLYGVAASSNRIIAVGTQSVVQGTTPAEGVMLSSTDGISWTEVQMPVSATLQKIVWAGNQFVAVGNLDGSTATPVALTSPDGVTWTSHAMNTGTLTIPEDIAWNGSRYVVVGAGAVATSTDGINWQESGVGIGGSFAVAWNGQEFLACGMTYCAISSDGTQWSANIQLPVSGATVYGLAWGDSKWVAVGDNSLVLTSP